MPKYCFDTSGISTPFEYMPEDIHPSMWNSVKTFIEDGNVAITTEIYDEMINIGGDLGNHIKKQKNTLIYEIDIGDWNWEEYIDHSVRMQNEYSKYISEYIGGTKKTVGLNDISIIALAKTLSLPLLSSETRVTDSSSNKRKIPNICDQENIEHYIFNDFLRTEGFINF